MSSNNRKIIIILIKQHYFLQLIVLGETKWVNIVHRTRIEVYNNYAIRQLLYLLKMNPDV